MPWRCFTLDAFSQTWGKSKTALEEIDLQISPSQLHCYFEQVLEDSQHKSPSKESQQQSTLPSCEQMEEREEEPKDEKEEWGS